jgi:uncharacterized protein YecT (DUF1311 family)
MVDNFRKKLTLLVVGLLVCLLTFAPFAEAAPCGKLLNEDALNECLSDELSLADKELNQTYANFRGKLTDTDRDLLKAAEAAWIKSRDNDCDFEAASVAGGTAYQSIYLTCMATRTKQRTKQLADWAKTFGKR